MTERKPTADSSLTPSIHSKGTTPPPATPAPKPLGPPTGQAAEAEAFAIESARMVADDKCEQVVVLDVRAISSITDYIVIASGTSDRQMTSILDHLAELGSGKGFSLLRSGVDEKATWVVADFGNVFVHIFEPNTRAHYDLEMLWGDAPRIAWERPDQLRRDWAGLKSSR